MAWGLHSGTAILSVSVYVRLGECWNAESQSEGPGPDVRRGASDAFQRSAQRAGDPLAL